MDLSRAFHGQPKSCTRTATRSVTKFNHFRARTQEMSANAKEKPSAPGQQGPWRSNDSGVCIECSVSGALVGMLIAMFQAIRDGEFNIVDPTLERVLGRTPTKTKEVLASFLAGDGR